MNLDLCFFQAQQRRPVVNPVTGLEMNGFDNSIGGRDDGMFHLHGLQRHQGLSVFNPVSGFDGYGNDSVPIVSGSLWVWDLA